MPHHLTDPSKNDVHTVITLTDNAPQGLNDSLTAFPLATKVGPFQLFHALRDGETAYINL